MTETATSERPEVVADRTIAAAWAAYYEALRPADDLVRRANEERARARTFRTVERISEFLLAAEKDQKEAEEIARNAKPLRRAALELDERLYTGWARFFLVADGHIHASTRCHTLRPTTSVSWLPELSGLTEADAVDAHGPLLCTVCFPSAPVEWTIGKEKPARCAGTGEYVPSSRRYVRCPECGRTVARTPSGLVRAHAPRAAWEEA